MDEVKVTQADREAVDAFHRDSFRALFETTDEGSEDQLNRAHKLLCQAFAHHRHQAERETLARMEPVAWMYERKGPWPARYFHDKRAPAYLDEGEGWTETPLYALPPVRMRP